LTETVATESRGKAAQSGYQLVPGLFSIAQITANFTWRQVPVCGETQGCVWCLSLGGIDPFHDRHVA